MKNIRIRAKLFKAFVAIILLVAAISVAGYWFVYQTEIHLQKIYDANFREVTLAADLSSALAKTQLDLLYFINANKSHPENIKIFGKKIEKNMSAMQRILANWKLAINKEISIVSGEEKKSELDELVILSAIQAQLRNYNSKIHKLLIKGSASDHKALSGLYVPQITKKYREIVGLISDARSSSIREIAEDLRGIHNKMSATMQTILFLVLLAFFASVMFGYLISDFVVKRVAIYIQKIQEGKDQLMHLAQHDVLTSLPNRLLFNEELARAVSKAKRHKENFAILLVNLDDFKTINDTYGHQIGDLLLKDVARRQRANLRAENFVARLGGDEFAIILTEIHEAQEAGVVAKKLSRVLSEPYMFGDKKIHLSVSIGIANFPVSADNSNDLIKNVDIALYRAKELGRNNYQFFTTEIGDKHAYKLLLEACLSDAVKQEQLSLVYQPLVSLADKRILGMEALLRWHHPKLGFVPPDVFIPVAEQHGFIMEIGEWVLRHACKEFVSKCSHYSSEFKLCVNVSPYQLANEHFLGKLLNILKETGMNPAQLEIEITETAIMEKLIGSEDTLKAFQDSGISISIDDFGTGYSSLSRLKSLPIHTLKIDKSFIQGVSKYGDDSEIVKSVLALAASLNLNVIAEGVETEQQLDFLVNNRCPDAQGYYFSRPVGIEEIVKILEKKEPLPS